MSGSGDGRSSLTFWNNGDRALPGGPFSQAQLEDLLAEIIAPAQLHTTEGVISLDIARVLLEA